MVNSLEGVRKAIRFALATFLWSHALFLLNVHGRLIDLLSQRLQFTAAEVVLFLLLVAFSFIAGSGLWRTFTNLTYIYFFPFVLFGYLFYWPFRIVFLARHWLTSKGKKAVIEAKPANSPLPRTLTLSAPISESEQVGMGEKCAAVFRVLARPFRKFTFLWCLLLLFATHKLIVWLAVAVFLLHLVRIVYRVVKFTVFSKSWLAKIEAGLRTVINVTLDKLSILNFDSASIAELKNLWNQIRGFEAAVRFVEDSPAFSRWLWLFCGGVLLSMYLYFAFLFSFAYFGIARVAETPFSWSESLVVALFVPFFVTELPNVIPLRILGGIHCTLVVTVGIGTIVNYFRRRLESLRSVAATLSVRLAAEETRAKYLVLQQRVEAGPGTQTPNPK